MRFRQLGKRHASSILPEFLLIDFGLYAVGLGIARVSFSSLSIKMAQFCNVQADQIDVERNPDIGAESRMLSGVL
jgi:hypothetical protein